MKHKLGIIGTGLMGLPIAINLHQDGFELIAYDKRENAVAQLKEKGIRVASSPKEVMENADVIFDVMNDTSCLQSVLTQENGLLAGMSGHKVIIDMTTSDPKDSIAIGESLKSHNVTYIDCAMTGGAIGAKNRKLLLMGGGDPAVFEECRYILDRISKQTIYLGKMGSGHYMKLIHNQLSHSTFLASCEAVLLGKRLGMDLNSMIEVFNCGNARSYATEVRFPQYILSGTYDAGGTFDTVHKDIGLVMKKADELHFDLPITKATYDYWSYPLALGKGQDDYSTIFKLLDEKLNG